MSGNGWSPVAASPALPVLVCGAVMQTGVMFGVDGRRSLFGWPVGNAMAPVVVVVVVGVVV